MIPAIHSDQSDTLIIVTPTTAGGANPRMHHENDTDYTERPASQTTNTGYTNAWGLSSWANGGHRRHERPDQPRDAWHECARNSALHYQPCLQSLYLICMSSPPC